MKQSYKSRLRNSSELSFSVASVEEGKIIVVLQFLAGVCNTVNNLQQREDIRHFVVFCLYFVSFSLSCVKTFVHDI